MQKRQSLPITARNTVTRHHTLGVAAVLATLVGAGVAQTAGAQPAPPTAAPPREVTVTTTLLGGSVYGIDGQGGRMAALVGPEGVFLVDAQFPAVTDKIVAAIKALSPAPLRFLVNTHVHGDHTGGNENFAKLGVTILGRPELREQQLHPRPARVIAAMPCCGGCRRARSTSAAGCRSCGG